MMKLVVLCVFLEVAASAFSAADKTAIVDAYNSFRSQIAKGNYYAKSATPMPTATNMYKLKWSNDLETTAQQWSNGCVFQHSGQAGVGENMYMMWSSGPVSVTGQGVQASNSWADEFQTYGWNYTDVILTLARFNTGVGHATQMAWGATQYIGCGATVCDTTKIIVTCQYKNQGNFLNSPLYKTGPVCSQCPTGTTCETATGLCA